MLPSEEPFTIGTQIALDFSLPNNKKVKSKAIVVRNLQDNSSANKGFGLSFFEITEKNQQTIDSFIEEQNK
jgi:c-di-GMP-binding flagellar brake protein YcgR